ncbi:MAG TPA: aminotransferase class I/II-fold pyridoxal phosphate-dependent enzyme [Patescibacteria group bacterium]|nr:aminotransferase class I/II-fold pyridoxal phosphate-dependent enzyme [Patescibacteria group bacterium]
MNLKETLGVDTMVAMPPLPSILTHTVRAPEVTARIEEMSWWYTPAWTGDRLPRLNVANWEQVLIPSYLQWFGNAGFLNIKQKAFQFQRWCNGSTEAIQGIINWIAEYSSTKTVYVLAGDYAGYWFRAKTLESSLVIRTVPRNQNPHNLPPGFVFISSPSAYDGALVSKELLSAWGSKHHIILDGVYAGMSQEVLDVTHPAIFAYVTSLSKPFGGFVWRSGLILAKENIPMLTENTDFKGVPGMAYAESLVNNVSLGVHFSELRTLQTMALRRIEKRTGYRLDPAPVSLLATLSPESEQALRLEQEFPEDASRFLRDAGGGKSIYRFSLGPAIAAVLYS